MGISTKGDASDVLDLQSYSVKAQCDPEEISNRINETLSRIAYTFVKDKPFLVASISQEEIRLLLSLTYLE